MPQAVSFARPRWFCRLISAALWLLFTATYHLHHATSTHPGELTSDGPPDVPTVVNDGLVWITPKPLSARQVGWEDEWMLDWKKRHYSPGQRVGCNTTDDTPYDDGLLCSIPGYIPARLVEPSRGRGPPLIPRVIFISWLERRLGRAMYTSILTLLNHNPEYELIFFEDEDIDRFVCESEKVSDFLPVFSKVQAGAMRADIWRLLVMKHYGGVYLDSDISSLNKLPIKRHDTAVSGLGCWSHLPGDAGGLFEHWAMAFMPGHPYISKAVAVMKQNLENPSYLMREDTPEAEAEDSVTMRLTGPAMYQYTLHSILEDAKCRKKRNSYCAALLDPERFCKDMGTFRSYFPEGLRLFRNINLGNAVTHKVFYPGGPWERETTDFQQHYDDPGVQMRKRVDPTFCDADAFAGRAAERSRIWMENIERND